MLSPVIISKLLLLRNPTVSHGSDLNWIGENQRKPKRGNEILYVYIYMVNGPITGPRLIF